MNFPSLTLMAGTWNLWRFMRDAPPLKPGDAVGIAAPSGAFDRRAFAAGVRLLEKWQLRPFYRDDIFERHRYFAGSHQRRRKELQDLLDNPSIKGLLFARGGFGLHHILPQLKLTKLRRYPKRMIAYSDLTLLLERIRQQTGQVTYYGPSVCDLGRAQSPRLKQVYREILFGKGKRKPWSLNRIAVIQEGKVEGTLVGGCLTLLSLSVGTPFEFKAHRGLLLLEDINESVYRVERMILHLKQAKKLQGVRGIIVSELTDRGRAVTSREWVTMLKEVFRGFRGPIIYGFQFGHVKNPHILPLGVQARLDTSRRELRLLKT